MEDAPGETQRNANEEKACVTAGGMSETHARSAQKLGHFQAKAGQLCIGAQVVRLQRGNSSVTKDLHDPK